MVEEEATKKQNDTKQPKDEEEKVAIPEKFKKMVENIEKMTVSDLAELVKILEKRFGVKAQPQVVASAPAAGAGAGAGGAAQGEEKSVFNVVLKEIGQKKIEVIKAVRDITQKGLKESKDLVDAVEKEPQVIKENVKKEEAEEMRKKFEAAGATVELK
ncbi:50S ribosomal protein L7/L12 [bacterium]|nr:50S ribosomal protein L7/L12 [bacterium]